MDNSQCGKTRNSNISKSSISGLFAVKARTVCFHWKKFRQINYLVISSKLLLSRNFCEKVVRENFCNFHTAIYIYDSKAMCQLVYLVLDYVYSMTYVAVYVGKSKFLFYSISWRISEET